MSHGPPFLAMQLHFGPRRLRAEGGISEPIHPFQGILAGCNQSVDVARVSLWEILLHLHSTYRPLKLDTWADDLSQRAVGHSQVVRKHTV